MIKKRKKVLIIVHGAKKINFKSELLNGAESQFLDYLTACRDMNKKDYHRLAGFLKDYYDKIIIFRWDGRIYSHEDKAGGLCKMLKKYKNESIDIIAVSLGGRISYLALSASPKIKINKLLYIGAIHDSHKHLKNVKRIINVYSRTDKMFFFANSFYAGIGNTLLKGANVINKPLENIRHDELLLNMALKNTKIPEKFLYDYYRKLLLGR